MRVDVATSGDVRTIKQEPHRNHVGGAVWVLRCQRRDVTAFQQVPNQRIPKEKPLLEPSLNRSHINVLPV